MLILAIDTALDACAAAVLDTETGKMAAHESQAMKRGHAEALMPGIARVMTKARVAYLDLDRVAVTTGPGSFTGLRVGISAARGIALGYKHIMDQLLIDRHIVRISNRSIKTGLGFYVVYREPEPIAIETLIHVFRKGLDSQDTGQNITSDT